MSATTLASCALRSARGGAVGEHPHRHVVFPDAVDPAGQMIFGAERGLEKAFDDFAVGKTLLLGALARGDGRNFAGGGRGPDSAVEREAGQHDRERGQDSDGPASCTHGIDAAATASLQAAIGTAAVGQRVR